MDRELEALAAEIFAEALEADAEARQAFIAARCGANARLQARVEALLAAHAKADALLHSPAVRQELQEASATLADRNVGRRIGPYQITRWLATGGMGRVYQGERRDADFDQRVAIKLLHAGLDPANVLERFRSERRLLARLEHPHIARLIDGGSTQDGEPYLVMEYVDGVPIDRYCDDQRLSVRDRLALFCVVCDAVQFAHRNLVVHRDLKPDNLFVDASGRVKLLDFGIAKVLDPEHDAEVTATVYRAMTPRYASPEQLRGEPVSTATDVYSLGVVLYELLTGRVPHAQARVTAPEFARLVTETDAVPPSVAVGRATDGAESEAACARRGTTPRKLSQQLAGDLDTIVLKALRKEPQRRYASVDELANDLRRHLNGLAVLARPDTLGYRVSKFARRNRALVAGVAVAFLALGAGMVASLQANRRAERHRAHAEWLAYQSSIAAAESSIRTNRLAEARQQLDAAPLRFRGWEWEHLARRLDRSLLRIAAHDAAVTAVQFTAGGTRIVSTSEDHSLRVWDATTGEAVARFGPFEGVPRTLAVDASGTYAAVGIEEGRVRVVELQGGSTVMRIDEDFNFAYLRPVAGREFDPQIAMLDRPSTWPTLDFHADGRHIAVGFFFRLTGVWDVQTQLPVATWDTEPRWHKRIVRFHPAQNLLAVASELNAVQLWNPATQRPVRKFGDGGSVDLCFDAAGRQIAACSQDQSIRVWDVESGQLVARILGHSGSIRAIEFDASGEVIVATATDGQMAAWEVSSGRRRWTYPGPTVSSQCIDRSPDGSRFVSGDLDGNIRVWRFDTHDVRTLAVAGRGFRQHWASDACVSAGGAHLATTANEAVSLVWDLEHPQRPTEIRLEPSGEPSQEATCITWLQAARQLVAGLADGHVVIQDIDSLRTVRRFRGHSHEICAVDARPGSAEYVTAARDSTLKIWATASSEPLRVLRGHAGAVLTARYSPDGRTIASGSADGTIRFWDADTGQLSATLSGHRDAVRRVAFSRDGAQLASASYDGTVRLWDGRAGTPIATVLDAGRRMYAVAFSHDGSRLAAGGMDGTVRLIDPLARREVARLHGHSSRIFWLGFTPDDRELISTSLDGTIRVWDGPAVH